MENVICKLLVCLVPERVQLRYFHEIITIPHEVHVLKQGGPLPER